MGQIYRIKDETGKVQYPLTVGDAVIIDGKKLPKVLKEISDKADQSGVTGIKGSAETEYRKGNVEITAENIGLGNVANESKETMFASPAFTGTPTAPTAAAGTNTTQVATTAFVKGAIDALDYTDPNYAAGKYVSKVTQTDGKILVEHADLPSQTNYGVTVTKKQTANTNAAASYTIAQAATNLSFDIDIPKDMVVSSGTVATYTASNAPAGVSAGTYLVLTLANATNDKVYINVGNLIEYVTSGSKTGDMVVVSVSSDHKVTATITDGTITKAKLNSSLQTAIDKAGSSVQSVAQGSANGTISVDGTDVPVKGLGDAAYKGIASGIAANDEGLVTAKMLKEAGYTTNTGTITKVTAGAGLSGGATAGEATLSLAKVTRENNDNGDVAGTNGTRIPVVESVSVDEYGRVDGLTIKTVVCKDTTYSAATTSAAGLMSAADKTKLEGLDSLTWEKVSDTEYDDAAILAALTA